MSERARKRREHEQAEGESPSQAQLSPAIFFPACTCTATAARSSGLAANKILILRPSQQGGVDVARLELRAGYQRAIRANQMRYRRSRVSSARAKSCSEDTTTPWASSSALQP